MERDRMIYTGLRCRVNVKAAFIDMCMESPLLEPRLLMSAVISAGCGEQVCRTVREEENGVFRVQVKLDEEKREHIYEELFGEKLRDGKLEQLSDSDRKLFEPIEMLHRKEADIDIIPFIACGIVRNSRSRSRLLTAVTGCEKECLGKFRGSEYDTAGYLQRYLLDERKAARLAIGLLLLLKEEETDEKYNKVMDVIYAGYKPIKNRIKKLDYLTGECYREAMAKDMVMELQLARMVIQMVIAEDLGIPVIQDYGFCQVVCMLQDCENNWKNGEVQEIDMSEGKRIYRKLLRKHWNPGAYYISAFLEEEEAEGAGFQNKMENLLFQFGLEIRALSGLCLEKWEAEALCAIFEEEDWERYRYLLLTATLCKYIQQIEAMYEREIPEEIHYRETCTEDAVNRLEYEKKRMEEKIRILEQQKKEKEDELAEAERRIGRLKRDGERKERRYEKERAELSALREAVRSETKGTGKRRPDREECVECEENDKRQKTIKEAEEPLDVRLDRSIVIGGHKNWQKKMRQCLPDSQFVASDHMNFDPAMLRNKKYIIVNTDILKHGIYYKIMSERKKEQKVLYVHGNNVDRVLKEIEEQL